MARQSACIIYCTTDKISEARRLSQLLIREKLAACVQISSQVESHFCWEGKVSKCKEYVLTIKTRQSLYPKIEKILKENHSYEVPQILAVPVIKMDKAYEKWFKAQLVKV